MFSIATAIVFGLAKREFLFNAKIKKNKIIIDKEDKMITMERRLEKEASVVW